MQSKHNKCVQESLKSNGFPGPKLRERREQRVKMPCGIGRHPTPQAVVRFPWGSGPCNGWGCGAV